MNMLARIVVALAVLSARAYGATFHTDDFESATDPGQQWMGGSVTGTAVVPVATGGPAGGGDGFLQIESTGGFLAAFNLRTDWTGNFAALDPLGGLEVNVDLMSPSGSGPLSIRLVMFGPNSARWTSVTAQSIPIDGVWRGYTFSLAATALVKVQGIGAYANLLSGVERVMFRHDPDPPSTGGTSVTGTLNLDNIELAKTVLPGDFDEDGFVDAADLTQWKMNFGAFATASHTQGDADADQDVDGADFLIWQRQLNAGAGGLSLVPEPLTASLSLIGTVAMTLLSRRRSS